jgi:hypothetical protein
VRTGRVIAGAAALVTAVGLTACGSAPGDVAGEATGSFPVRVSASFPHAQRLAEQAALTIRITNAGTRAMPDPAVTITNPAAGTAAQAFGDLLPTPAPGQPTLAGRSRPIWIIDQPPGPCQYSCSVGGPGAYATAFSDTWALGHALAPGQSVAFVWKVTATRAGSFQVHYQVAAGLSGKARAEGNTAGTLDVTVSSQPREQYVNNNGQIVG